MKTINNYFYPFIFIQSKEYSKRSDGPTTFLMCRALLHKYST